STTCVSGWAAIRKKELTSFGFLANHWHYFFQISKPIRNYDQSSTSPPSRAFLLPSEAAAVMWSDFARSSRSPNPVDFTVNGVFVFAVWPKT
ncbi:MAG TPA: hypothetical protein PLB32_02110, partial [Acidobacteriota bacterium]|nr:hypothetical protein [Acidobacteriota bacterium]HNH81076.1 hypothetical protein [Acidobacteriota bacterium]